MVDNLIADAVKDPKSRKVARVQARYLLPDDMPGPVNAVLTLVMETGDVTEVADHEVTPLKRRAIVSAMRGNGAQQAFDVDLTDHLFGLAVDEIEALRFDDGETWRRIVNRLTDLNVDRVEGLRDAIEGLFGLGNQETLSQERLATVCQVHRVEATSHSDPVYRLREAQDAFARIVQRGRSNLSDRVTDATLREMAAILRAHVLKEIDTAMTVVPMGSFGHNTLRQQGQLAHEAVMTWSSQKRALMKKEAELRNEPAPA